MPPTYANGKICYTELAATDVRRSAVGSGSRHDHASGTRIIRPSTGEALSNPRDPLQPTLGNVDT